MISWNAGEPVKMSVSLQLQIAENTQETKEEILADCGAALKISALDFCATMQFVTGRSSKKSLYIYWMACILVL